MIKTISLDKALALRDDGALLLDARSPAEFVDGTIPGAVNIPLLDDAQRQEIGTLYKRQGKAAARLRGVELVAPQIPQLVARTLAARGDDSGPVVVFCWRGGMRSAALTSFLNLAGLPALQLEGGHKRFRRHVLEFFAEGEWGRLIVLRGLTGVGKTRLLQRLARQDCPVLDLEALANHRGSAFGALGLGSQPTQKQFEALLWDRLRAIPPGSYALTEGESRHIGRLVLPKRLYDALQVETSLWLEASLAYRVEVILADYPARDALKEEFVRPLEALRERLGREAVAELLSLLDQGAWQELIRRLMVDYYDPLYRHTKPEQRIEVAVEPEASAPERIKAAVAQILAGG